MSSTAKLFMHGRSQAVRLPKEFRFSGTEVRLTKVGDKVIMEPVNSPATLDWDLLDKMVGGDFPDRDQPPMPPDRPMFGS